MKCFIDDIPINIYSISCVFSVGQHLELSLVKTHGNPEIWLALYETLLTLEMLQQKKGFLKKSRTIKANKMHFSEH